MTGEEHGLAGSDFFASYPTMAAASIAANVNIDRVTLFYDFKDIVAVGGEHSSLVGVVDSPIPP